MVTRQGEIKLIDLGIARFFNPRKKTDTHVMGTPGFCPPEQYRGRTDVRSDIYSFGTTLFHLLTKEDVERFAFRFPGVRLFNQAVSPALEAIIARCTRINPDERFQTVEELQAALGNILPSHNPSLIDRLVPRIGRRKKP
jgi:serine/threonine-protein kinase